MNTSSISTMPLTVETVMRAIEALGPMPPRIRFRYSKMLDEFDKAFRLGHELHDLQVWCVPESWRVRLEAEGAETATERDLDAVMFSFDWLKVVEREKSDV